MKTILALEGRGRSRKTETIKQVYRLLKEEYPAAKCEEHALEPDLKVIMHTVDGLIGLESQGDPYGRLRDSLAEFAEAGCRVIVCATRTSGMTVDWVKINKDYDAIWFKQEYANANDQGMVNTAMAERMTRWVLRALKA